MQVYERKSFPRSARELKIMYEKGNLSFDNAVQRHFIWKNTAKNNKMSMLIDSMMRGLPVPPMYCNCVFEDVKKRVYDFLDGKQRTLTIIKFLKDEFSLVNIPTFEDEDGNELDLNGLTYSQLPEDFQDKVKTYSLTVYYYENMIQEDAEEMFRRLNNGKSLTAIELARASAASKDVIKKLGTHPVFDIALSERSLAGYANEDIAVKVWITLYSDKKSLEKKNTKPIMESTVISNEQAEEIEKIFDLHVELYNILSGEKRKKVIKEILNKTNLISLSSILKIAIDNNIDLESIKKWLIIFFDTGSKDVSVNSEYNDNAKGRETVTETAVKARMRILEENFRESIDMKDV